MSDEKIEVCFMDIFSLFSCFCSDGSFRAEHGTYREGYFPDVFQSFKRRFNIGDQGVRSGVFSSLYSGCISVLWVVAFAGGFLIFGEDRRSLWHDVFILIWNSFK